MNKRICCEVAAFMLSFSGAMVMAANQPTFTVVATWPGGFGSQAILAQGTDGNFYGTTAGGGANRNGTVFRVSPQGGLQTIYYFCSQPNCADGTNAANGLVLGTDGNFYGTTQQGGTVFEGTIFKVTPTGALTTLHSFTGPDGGDPWASLVQGRDGDFYGTTLSYAANGYGTIFKITPAGQLTTLYNFCSQPNCTDGNRAFSPLVQAPNGDFYGETDSGGDVSCDGVYGCGTIFAISPAGAYRVLHEFTGGDGVGPEYGLLQGANGNFYGTTVGGGTNSYGTIFQVTPAGTLTSLYSFNGSAKAHPECALVEGDDGKFFGTTASRLPHGANTIFEVTSTGALTTLHNFSTAQGQSFGGLVQGTDGAFYGSTTSIIYKISLGLPPIVKAVPPAGPVGTTVMILGTNLTGTTGVSFNGTSAAFQVVSATEITATVPAAASTGRLVVTTPAAAIAKVGPFVVTR